MPGLTVDAINGFILALLAGALVIGLALGWLIGYPWGYEQAQADQHDDQTIYSSEESTS